MDALRAIRPTVPEKEAPDASDIRELQAKEQVWGILEQLSPEHRSILALHYLQGFDVKEIANILQKPEGTVKSRLFTAREKFRLML
jgi:RNA polymerase sigma-70 factor (ECF subfamily)